MNAPGLPLQRPKRILFDATGQVSFRSRVALPFTNGVQEAAVSTIEDLRPSFWITGNRGNLIHAEAPAKLFKKDSAGSAYASIVTLHTILGDRYADLMSENFDAIVLPMANFIRPECEIPGLLPALKALGGRVKFYVLGAGLQGEHPISSILPGNQDLIAFMNENAEVFGVRGERTQEWLHRNGFKNSIALGCPSLFVYPTSIAGIDFSHCRALGRRSRIMTAGHLKERFFVGGKRNKNTDFYLKGFSEVNADYVFQDEIFDYSGIKNKPDVFNESTSQLDAECVNGYFHETFNIKNSFGRYFYFNEAGAWRQAAHQYDVFVGDRFHGGVAALQVGVPALFLVHDVRVEELASFFDFPHMHLRKFANMGLYQAVKAEMTEEAEVQMKKTYARRYKAFCDTMESKGLPVENVADLSAPPAARAARRSGFFDALMRRFS